VTSTAGSLGGVASYQFQVRGVAPGTGAVTTRMVSPSIQGVTIDVATIDVTRE